MNEDDLYYALSLFRDSGFQILGKPWKILFCGRSRRSVSIRRQINAFANLTWHLPFGLFKFMKPVWIGSLDPWYKVIQDSQSVFLFFFSTKDRGCRIVAALLLIGPKSLLCMVQFDLIPCPQGIIPGICNFFFLGSLFPTLGHAERETTSDLRAPDGPHIRVSWVLLSTSKIDFRTILRKTSTYSGLLWTFGRAYLEKDNKCIMS